MLRTVLHLTTTIKRGRTRYRYFDGKRWVSTFIDPRAGKAVYSYLDGARRDAERATVKMMASEPGSEAWHEAEESLTRDLRASLATY